MVRQTATQSDGTHTAQKPPPTTTQVASVLNTLVTTPFASAARTAEPASITVVNIIFSLAIFFQYP